MEFDPFMRKRDSKTSFFKYFLGTFQFQEQWRKYENKIEYSSMIGSADYEINLSKQSFCVQQQVEAKPFRFMTFIYYVNKYIFVLWSSGVRIESRWAVYPTVWKEILYLASRSKRISS